MVRLLEKPEQRSRPAFMLASLGFLALVGLVDYLTGFEVFCSAFYLLGIGLGAWFVGRGFGVFLAVLSAGISIGGDLAAGGYRASPLVSVWNALILLALYFSVVWLLASLRVLHRDLEMRVR